MSIFLGIDTSNYTTSAALFDADSGQMFSKRKLLSVRENEIGLRQSDAVFQHVIALPEMLTELFSEANRKPDVIGASVSPRDAAGSYMPCFTVGSGTAKSTAAAMGIPVRCFSHQAGHIAAALWSAERLDLLKSEFIAFHVSGGTTEAVLVKPDADRIFTCEIIAQSLDLKAGQAIDRVGRMLSLGFPAGMQLDALSRESTKVYKIKPYFRDASCSLSGIENICAKMLADGEKAEDIAKYCIEYICAALAGMARELQKTFGGLPVVFSGGVTSNTIMRERFTKEFAAVFAQKGFACDNAAGIAVLASLKG